MAEAGGSPRAFEFSIVTAVYNVAQYLDAFIESVEAQSYPRDGFDVVAVDDGSTDDSLAKLRAWEQRRPDLVTVITKENGGLPSARNAGLGHVRGTWVTFTDPDDVLDAAYVSEVSRFIAANPRVDLVATNRLILDEATDVLKDTHPLRHHFGDGNVVRDITSTPEYFHGSAPAAFFPMAEIERQGLRFDPEMRPNWEDGHFCSRYLLALERPTIGYVATAHYHYRKRFGSTSTLQGSFNDPRRFTTVPRRGFLDVLERAHRLRAGDSPPKWLQHFILYELSWYFSAQEARSGVATAATDDVADTFHGLVREILRYIDPDVITRFSARPLKPEWIDILLHAYTDEPWHQDHAILSKPDRDQGVVRASYRYVGQPPREEVVSAGHRAQPLHAKIRDFVYHGRVLLHERIMWLPAPSDIRIRLDGRDLQLRSQERRLDDARRVRVLEQDSSNGRPKPSRSDRSAHRPRFRDRVWRRLSRTRLVRRYFRDAWVLMDRIGDAGDNGERLFRYLRGANPGINAWFAVARESPDWTPLRRQFGRRVLAHGSLRWKLAMANAQHLISSHVDTPIVRPPALRSVIKPRWRFTFLQHGVIKDDISNWLNAKPVDLFITSTPQELASITGDHTPYVFTTKEVKLTGMPRFDRLRDLGARIAPEARDLLLVAPTWRVGLLRPLRPGERRRAIVPAFLESAFVRNWLELMRSDELAVVCAEQRLTIGFLPHPELQPALSLMTLPNHVRALTFADHDVQELFARSALFVTDYSSMAFNAAYIDRPIVYFQFDADEVERGGHLGRRGYFEYARDGFGPIASTPADAVASIGRVLRSSRAPAPEYQARIDATFPQRDGFCCARVTREIRRLTERQLPDDDSSEAGAGLNLRTVARVQA